MKVINTCSNPECGVITAAGGIISGIGKSDLQGFFCTLCGNALVGAPADILDAAADLQDLFARLRRHAREERRACREDDPGTDCRRHPNEL